MHYILKYYNSQNVGSFLLVCIRVESIYFIFSILMQI